MMLLLRSGGRLAAQTCKAPSACVKASYSHKRDTQRCHALHLGLLASYMQTELVMEGVLHVSSAQSAACRLQAAEFPDVLSPAGISAQQVPARGRQQVHSMMLEALLREADGTSMRQHHGLSVALCLATPPDAPEGEGPQAVYSSGLRTSGSEVGQASEAARRSGAQASSSSTVLARAPGLVAQQAPRVTAGGSSSGASGCRALSSLEAEELLLMEAAAVCEHAHQADAGVVEVLLATAAVRRRRRRKLLRVLRRGRQAAAMLQKLSPGSVFA